LPHHPYHYTSSGVISKVCEGMKLIDTTNSRTIVLFQKIQRRNWMMVTNSRYKLPIQSQFFHFCCQSIFYFFLQYQSITITKSLKNLISIICRCRCTIILHMHPMTCQHIIRWVCKIIVYWRSMLIKIIIKMFDFDYF
jgi:hypothetical protein